MSTQGHTSESRLRLCDQQVKKPVAQNSQDLAQETDISIDFRESMSLNSHP